MFLIVIVNFLSTIIKIDFFRILGIYQNCAICFPYVLIVNSHNIPMRTNPSDCRLTSTTAQVQESNINCPRSIGESVAELEFEREPFPFENCTVFMSPGAPGQGLNGEEKCRFKLSYLTFYYYTTISLTGSVHKRPGCFSWRR